MKGMMPVINSITVNLYYWRPWNGAIEELAQRFVYFHLNLLNLCYKGSMKENNLFMDIGAFSGLLT